MELNPGQLVGQYEIVRKLGSGGQGSTYAATSNDGDEVAIKAISMGTIPEWKTLELFEREARFLESVSHKNIPSYLDFFNHEGSHFLVQELIVGRTLNDLVASGRRLEQDDLEHIAATLLEVLVYVHGLSPSVVHRDIKPRNIMIGEDGLVTLVDFGGVSRASGSGSTVVGTYGYMAPETFQGNADARSDLYGLGASLIFAMTGQEPNKLPIVKLRIDFRSAVDNDDAAFQEWLDSLIAPAPEDRFESAKVALETLRANERLSLGMVSPKINDDVFRANRSGLPVVEAVPEDDQSAKDAFAREALGGKASLGKQVERTWNKAVGKKNTRERKDAAARTALKTAGRSLKVRKMRSDVSIEAERALESYVHETPLVKWDLGQSNLRIHANAFRTEIAIPSIDWSANKGRIVMVAILIGLVITIAVGYTAAASSLWWYALTIPFWVLAAKFMFWGATLVFGSEMLTLEADKALTIERRVFGIPYKTDVGKLRAFDFSENLALHCGPKTFFLSKRMADQDKRWIGQALDEHLSRSFVEPAKELPPSNSAVMGLLENSED